MARWDSPLFVLPWDEEVPLEDIWLAVTKGEKKPPTNSAQHVSHPSHLCPLLWATLWLYVPQS